jgi:CO dehydrogenase maturation factor
VRSIVGEIVSNSRELTLMDMEASIEHLSRGTVRHVDALLIVVEPYYRALETAGRILPLARGLGINRVYGIANKLRTPQDEEAVKAYCQNHDLELIAAIPFDENVTEADRTGRAIIDYDAASAIVEEVSHVADFLQREITPTTIGAGGM